MTIHETNFTGEPVSTTREKLRAAQADYRKASARWDKIDATISNSEKLLSTRTIDLDGYKNLDQDVQMASAKLLLKGTGALKLSEAIAKQISDRDAIKGDIKILEGGLVSLREQLKQAYSAKRDTWFALIEEASEIVRAQGSLPLSNRLAALKEEQRQIVKNLRAFESASITHPQHETFYIARKDFLGQLGAQLIFQEPGHDLNVALATSVTAWFENLLRDPDAMMKE